MDAYLRLLKRESHVCLSPGNISIWLIRFCFPLVVYTQVSMSSSHKDGHACNLWLTSGLTYEKGGEQRIWVVILGFVHFVCAVAIYSLGLPSYFMFDAHSKASSASQSSYWTLFSSSCSQHHKLQPILEKRTAHRVSFDVIDRLKNIAELYLIYKYKFSPRAIGSIWYSLNMSIQRPPSYVHLLWAQSWKIVIQNHPHGDVYRQFHA